jgi:hypothetical protein
MTGALFFFSVMFIEMCVDHRWFMSNAVCTAIWLMNKGFLRANPERLTLWPKSNAIHSLRARRF